ncbi:hypothetical protein Trydic_g8760, partial [Trypoxylus dichotomus]
NGCAPHRRNTPPSQRPALSPKLPGVSDRQRRRMRRRHGYHDQVLHRSLRGPRVEFTQHRGHQHHGQPGDRSDPAPKHPTWNSRVTNASGKCLRRFADDFNLEVDASIEPTIYPHNGQPDVLDIVVMKNVNHFHQLTVLNELSSDHNPVLLQLGQPAPEEEDTPTRHSISWPAFTDHLSNNMGPIERIEDVTQLEAAVQTVTDRVLYALQYAIRNCLH